MSNRQRPPPCVLLADGAIGSPLHIIRSLGRRGVPVHVITTGCGAKIFRSSRWCATATDIAFSTANEFMQRALASLGRQLPSDGATPIIPMSDRTLAALASTDDLPPHLVRSIPAGDVDELLRKDKVMLTADSVGFQVPRYVVVESESDITTAASLHLPAILRPAAWDRGGRRPRKFTIATTVDDLTTSLRQALDDGAQLIAQEYVEGGDDQVEMCFVWRRPDHDPVLVTGRKMRQDAPKGGVMVWGMLEDIPDLRRAVLRLCDELGFVGLGGVEVKRSPAGLQFIEMNMRVEATHFLTELVGLETPWLEYCWLTGQSVRPAPPQALRGAGWVGAAWIRRTMERGGLRQGLADYRSFRRMRPRVYAMHDRTDPRPGTIQLTGLLAGAARRAFRPRSG